jgi:hypothetical protein
MSSNMTTKEAVGLLGTLKARTGLGTMDLLVELLRKEEARLDEVERRIRKGLAADERLRASWYALPLVDPRPIEEILAYDEDGLRQ